MNDEEILELVSKAYDAIQILDLLDMDEEDLVEALSDKILSNKHKFDELDTFMHGN